MKNSEQSTGTKFPNRANWSTATIFDAGSRPDRIANAGTSESVKKAWETRREHGSIGQTSSGKVIPALDHEVYSARQKFPKWNGTVAPDTHADVGGKLLLHRLPDWSKKDHEEAAHAHLAAKKEHQEHWGKSIESAAQETFKRPYHPLEDYKISAIGRDEFSDKHKAELRHHAVSAGTHSSLAQAHWKAAGHRNPL